MARKPRSEAGAKALHPKGTAKRKASSKPQAKAQPKTKATAEGLDKPEAKEEVEAILKRYRGRPTKYDPAFCDMVILWGKLGKSKTWMAAELMVLVETMTEWGKAHPEFSAALGIAKQLEQQHWEDMGHDSQRSVGFQGAMWSRSMAARFPKTWREKTQVDHGLSDGLAALLGEIDGDSSSLV